MIKKSRGVSVKKKQTRKWACLVAACFFMFCSTNQKVIQNSVKNNGAKGDGIHDDTQAIQAALDKNETVYLPKGTYLVSHLIVRDNRNIKTDGFETLLKQKSNQAAVAPLDIDKTIIVILGSNVVIDKLSCEGNINAYEGEQNHAVLLLPTTKNIQNVHLKGLNIKNVRGDAVCIGNTRFFCENIVVENLTAQNIYRNGVSITSGRGIQLTNIDVQQSGMDGIDIEGEGTPEMPLENLTITNAFIGNLCVTGITQKAKNINVKQLHIDGQRKGSSPPYKPMNPAGIIVSETENAVFDAVLIENLPEFAILSGDVEKKESHLSKNITFNNLTVRTSSLNEKRYNAYICVMGFTDVTFNNLNANVEKDKALFLGKPLTFKGTQQVNLNKATVKGGQHLAKNCHLLGKEMTVNTEGVCLSGMTETSVIEKSEITCLRMTEKTETSDNTKIPMAYNTKKGNFKSAKFDLKNSRVIEKEEIKTQKD